MITEITRINEGICGDPENYIKKADEVFSSHIRDIAENIAKNKNERPVILLSGPSGSGKTTTALMLEKMLEELGCPTHTLSMDNYFVSLTAEEKELAAKGEMDLESPLRIDKDLLNEQIKALEECKKVDVPKYNFADSKRDGVKLTLERKAGELVIFEGIHALNPEVITVSEDKLCKLYVSVRTRIAGNDVILHPSKIRLMRRMLRDRNFRKRALRETMAMFRSVEDGENKYIMPYKNRADFDIDTFVPYEMSVYRDNLMDDLRQMTDIPELADVISVMSSIAPLDSEFVPKNSLVREFIGNGEFEY